MILASGYGMTLGEGEEELLQFGPVQARVLLLHALLQSGGDDGESCLVQGAGDGGKLRNHALAVPAFFDHACDRRELALGAAQAVNDGLHVGGIEFHGGLPE